MIYRVHMRLTCEVPKNLKRRGRMSVPPVWYEDCLVEADNIDQAGRIGDQFIQANARTDVKLIGAELLSVATVRLPMAIS